MRRPPYHTALDEVIQAGIHRGTGPGSTASTRFRISGTCRRSQNMGHSVSWYLKMPRVYRFPLNFGSSSHRRGRVIIVGISGRVVTDVEALNHSFPHSGPGRLMRAEFLKPVVDEVHHGDEDGHRERMPWKGAGGTSDAAV